MQLRGEKTALDQAVAEARQRELQELPRQLALFERAASESGESEAFELQPRGPGRPVGARNRRTDEAARIYMQELGDPLRRGTAISALPILAPGVLEGLAQRLSCSKLEVPSGGVEFLGSSLFRVGNVPTCPALAPCRTGGSERGVAQRPQPASAGDDDSRLGSALVKPGLWPPPRRLRA